MQEEDIDLLFIAEEGVAVEEPVMATPSTEESSPSDDKTETPQSESPKEHSESPPFTEMETREGETEEGVGDKSKQVCTQENILWNYLQITCLIFAILETSLPQSHAFHCSIKECYHMVPRIN